jgi:hypothetical protein
MRIIQKNTSSTLKMQQNIEIYDTNIDDIYMFFSIQNK